MGYFVEGSCYADLATAGGVAAARTFPRFEGGKVLTAQVTTDGKLRVSSVDSAMGETVAVYPLSFPPCDAAAGAALGLEAGGVVLAAVVVVALLIVSFRPLLVNP